MKTWILAILAIFLLELLVPSCGAAQTKIVDCVGRDVNISGEVDRIISLNADATRVLISLGVGDRIIAVESSTKRDPMFNETYPRLSEIEDVGSHFSGTLNIERVVALKPDVILFGGSSRETADTIQNQTGIPCACSYVGVKKVEDFLCGYQLMGKIVNKENRSSELQRFISDEINGVIEISSKLSDSEKPRVLMVGSPFDHDPFKVTILSGAIDWAGGINVAAEPFKGGAPTKTVSMEQIAQWNPDVIMISGLSFVLPEDILGDPSWKQLKAVKDGKVYKVYSSTVGYDPALFVIQTLQMAKIMHPDKFDFDFAAKADQVFEKIYGISGLHPVFSAQFGISKV